MTTVVELKKVAAAETVVVMSVVEKWPCWQVAAAATVMAVAEAAAVVRRRLHYWYQLLLRTVPAVRRHPAVPAFLLLAHRPHAGDLRQLSTASAAEETDHRLPVAGARVSNRRASFRRSPTPGASTSSVPSAARRKRAACPARTSVGRRSRRTGRPGPAGNHRDMSLEEEGVRS